MQVIFTIVCGEAIFLAFEREVAIGDAVSISPRNASEIGTLLLVLGQGLESQGYVSEIPIAVGSENTYDGSSVIGHLDLHSVGVSQGIKGGLLAIGHFAKGLLRNRHGRKFYRGILVQAKSLLGRTICFFRLFGNVGTGFLEAGLGFFSDFGKSATGGKSGYAGGEDKGLGRRFHG